MVGAPLNSNVGLPKTMRADFDKLIPELKDWNNGKGIDPESWVGCSGNYRLAVGYSLVFWPEFVRFEQYVLREGFSEEALRGFEKQHNNDHRSIEAVMNHIHLNSIQHLGCEDASEERLIYLGRVLKQIYEAKLKSQFPEQSFTVLFEDSADRALSDYKITFFQTP